MKIFTTRVTIKMNLPLAFLKTQDNSVITLSL